MSDQPPVLIKGGHLVDPVQAIDGTASILIANGKIKAIATNGEETGAPEGATIIDARDKHVFPGLIDAKVHCGEPGSEHRETIASVSRAAAAGGVTGIIMMPDTNPVIDDVSLVDFITRAARDNAEINIYPSVAVTRGFEGKELTEFGLLQEAGAVMLSEGRGTITNNLTLRRALTYAKDFNLVISMETVDPDLAPNGVMNEGLTATHLGLSGIPREAEIIPLERDLRLAKLTGGRYHAASISTSSSAKAIAHARQEGVHVTAGVTINHLTLNENDIGRYRTFFKLAPPLRSEEDRVSMVEAVASGAINLICSGHDPQDVDTKRLPFAEAADGAIGLETLFAAALRLFHNGDLSLSRLVEVLSSNPARIFGLEGGTLRPGSAADLFIADIHEPWVLGEEDIVSMSKNTPFEGARFSGRVLQTLVAGRTVFQN